MTVTVTLTDLIVLPQSQIAPLRSGAGSGSVEPATGFESWFLAGSDTGDVSGGQAVCNFRFPRDEWYYTVTAVAIANNSAVDENGRWNITAADFEEYQQAGINRTWSHRAIVSAGNTSIEGHDWDALYLGRAITEDSDLTFQWTTNTDGKAYTYRLAGLRSLRPGVPWFNALQQGRAL